ncbi:MAG: 4Fe-4S dicluster domain-containing protein [Wolinella sp.]
MSDTLEKSGQITRRSFFKHVALASTLPMVASATSGESKANSEKKHSNSAMASIIDLTLCDGCAGYEMPLCVSACREKNSANFPEPQKPIMDYWPQKKHEDWSNRRDLTSRLTPYNWTFVEKLEIDGEQVFIPRRCMHCDDAPCQKLCPFGIIGKSEHGAVKIDANFCMGGAKCRDACPWNIPQRQAGVGLYLKLAPKLAGGGVMYKCDMCADLLKAGKKPACEVKCPKNAILFGKRDEIEAEAKRRAESINGYIYGMNENGGTATLYISKIPFEKIDKAISRAKNESNDKLHGRPHMKVGIKNPMQESENLAKATLIAPLAGIIGAGIAVYKSHKNSGENQ